MSSMIPSASWEVVFRYSSFHIILRTSLQNSLNDEDLSLVWLTSIITSGKSAVSNLQDKSWWEEVSRNRY